VTRDTQWCPLAAEQSGLFLLNSLVLYSLEDTEAQIYILAGAITAVAWWQVARALLDDKSSPSALVGATQRVPLASSSAISSQQLLVVLKLFESSLIATIRDALKAAGSAAAAQQAFDDNLDLVLELGWVHVERLCLGYMLQVRHS
jgi:hypothetical protein